MCAALHLRAIATATLFSIVSVSCGHGGAQSSPESDLPQSAPIPTTDEPLATDWGSFDDALLELRLRLALLERVGVPALGVELRGQGGEVRLRGRVPTLLQVKLIRDIAAATPGVRHVDCRLEVPPDPSEAVGPLEQARQRLADALLAARARAALVRELGRGAFDLVIEAADSTLTVRGSLADRDSVERALAAVAQVEGVEQIQDRLDLDG